MRSRIWLERACRRRYAAAMRLPFVSIALLALSACARPTSDGAAATTASASPSPSAASAPSTSTTASASAPPVDASTVSTHVQKTNGTPYIIRIAVDTVQYCDAAGGRESMQLSTAHGSFADGACPKAPTPNATCKGVAGITAVRAGHDDDALVTKKGASVRVAGHVRDCAGDAAGVAIASTGGVALVDADKGTTRALSNEGAERVAIDPTWIAWTQGDSIHADVR